MLLSFHFYLFIAIVTTLSAPIYEFEAPSQLLRNSFATFSQLFRNSFATYRPSPRRLSIALMRNGLEYRVPHDGIEYANI